MSETNKNQPYNAQQEHPGGEAPPLGREGAPEYAPPSAGQPAQQQVPPGTYPPQPNGPGPAYAYPPQPWPQQPPPPQKKTRRVGTLTMALSLIAVGVILILRIFLPGLDYITLARLSPLILVLLGAEMLIASMRHRDEKLRFDGLSIFISILLIGVTLVAAAVPEVVHYAFGGRQTSNRLAAELELETASLLESDGSLPVYNVEWYIDLSDSNYSTDMTPADIRPGQYVQARVFIPGNFTEPAAFARDCRRVADLLETQVPHIDYASFYSTTTNDAGYAGDITFSLWLDNPLHFGYDAARLADMVQTNYWNPDERYYMTQYELDEWLEEKEQKAEEEQQQDAQAAENETDDLNEAQSQPGAA